MGLLTPKLSNAQCSLFGAQGSRFLAPPNICAPVSVNIEYEFTPSFPPPGAATLTAKYDWGDGSAIELIPMVEDVAFPFTWRGSRIHAYPDDPAECDYAITINLVYDPDGAGPTPADDCIDTIEPKEVASWHEDNLTGGNVETISQNSNNPIEPVCEGDPVDVIFADNTTYNCNVDFDPDPLLPRLPNEQLRWVQFIYGDVATGARIPNIKN